MSEYKAIVNPFTGQLQLVPTNIVLSFKAGVATQASLPLTGNAKGDARIANDTGHYYVWSIDVSSGLLTDWVDAGDMIDVDWSAVTNRPSSTVVNIDDAVTKKHTQNTDQYLDYGGVNQRQVSQIATFSTTGTLNFYVNDSTGNDSNNGTIGSPWKTIGRAVSAISGFTIKRDTFNIWLRAGTYTLSSTQRIENLLGSGVLKISAYQSEIVLITGSANQGGVFLLDKVQLRTTFTNLQVRVTANNRNCFSVQNCLKVFFRGCKFGDNNNTGTKGVNVPDGGTLSFIGCSDIDSNKVDIGITVNDGIAHVETGSQFGDTTFDNTSGSTGINIIYNGGKLNLSNVDYDDAISKKHAHSNASELDKVTIGDHDVTAGNPHNTTPSGIGAIDEAIDTLPEKTTPVDDDLLILQDSEESNLPLKKIKKSNLVTSGVSLSTVEEILKRESLAHEYADIKGLFDDIAVNWVDMGQMFSCGRLHGFVSLENGVALACGWDTGKIMRTNDYGLTWNVVYSTGAGGGSNEIYYLGRGICLAGTWTNTLRSTDYGLTWAPIAPNVPYSDAAVYVYLGNGRVIASGINWGYTYLSTDYGLNWAFLTPERQPFGGSGSTGPRTFCNLGNGIVLAGANDAKIWKSVNNGVDWTAKATLDAGTVPAVFKLIYLGNGIVIAGTQNFGRIFRSTDYGENWTNLGQQYGENTISALCYVGNGVVLAGGSNSKLLKSTDYGATWVDMGALFYSHMIHDLCYLGKGVLLAGTGGGNIIRSSLCFEPIVDSTLTPKVYSQDAEPTLDDNKKVAIWIDTNDSYRVYLIFRRGNVGSGYSEQVKVELL